MRSMWNGTLHLAELAIPVGLAAGKGRSDVQLTTLHRVCRNPLEQSKECPIHGDVPGDELVKAWQVTPGEYVLVERDELEAAEKLPDDHRLDVIAIVPRVDVDPTMVLNTYFVKPAGRGAQALRPYALLVQALAETDAAALVRFHAWGGEHIAAIRPLDEQVLVAQTLVAPEDLRTGEEIAAQLEATEVTEQERELGRELLERMLIPLTPELLRNQRRERVRALVQNKLTGEGTVRADPVDADTKNARVEHTVDLADALQRSVKATKKPRRRSGSRRPVAA
jgi:DNA end-binding protein Ku